MNETNVANPDEIVRNTFGALLRSQGRGFFVALEFLAIIKGTKDAGGTILPGIEAQDSVQLLRRSHDFARRLMFDPDILQEQCRILC